jgi:hypothetical protein
MYTRGNVESMPAERNTFTPVMTMRFSNPVTEIQCLGVLREG